ncbi:DUF3810 domain-containing protein [Sphingobacterium rhinopitheci]|uniref:DUF3810 domain-containing protein n=1 Tax=Sphingobacterium rhinopitheci TaxID=2781960 RepID=UPI001F51DF0B|nr:DUF3810 domain-containing protein [Sphingobacterium rhinopitheci]MCI0921788.1 DUF3810 domain-containing protein [Sphingobacterium rhinopitheci]
MKASRNTRLSRIKYYWIISVCLIIQFLIFLVKDNTIWVEYYYSRAAYPIIAYLNKFLFSWIPFSIGDIFYGLMVLLFTVSIRKIIGCSFRRKWNLVAQHILHLVTVILLLYTFFYVNWGLNYYRQPIATSIGLDLKNTTKEDYLQVLEKYILKANALRHELDLDKYPKDGVKQDMEYLMQQDTVFAGILSKTQIKIKHPISSELISYFTVSGYFNPFTSEVQVNSIIPKPGYPFVNVHELAHQMGIGFEDDCNFIAFRKLVHHDNLWYRYSAYYNAIQALLQPIYADKQLVEKYRKLMSPKVKNDLQQEYAFWRSYTGFLDRISSIFYNGYLQHNNQPEGLERYNMMARLIVAWDKQQ